MSFPCGSLGLNPTGIHATSVAQPQEIKQRNMNIWCLFIIILYSIQLYRLYQLYDDIRWYTIYMLIVSYSIVYLYHIKIEIYAILYTIALSIPFLTTKLAVVPAPPGLALARETRRIVAVITGVTPTSYLCGVSHWFKKNYIKKGPYQWIKCRSV